MYVRTSVVVCMCMFFLVCMGVYMHMNGCVCYYVYVCGCVNVAVYFDEYGDVYAYGYVYMSYT